MDFSKNTRGFTLAEILIAISISAMIVSGSTFFIFKANSEVQTAKSRTKIHTEMSTFIEKMNLVRTGYMSGGVLIQNEPWYDVILFQNSWATTGVLIGVVNLGKMDGSGGAKLDATSEFDKYDNKAIGIQELNKAQLASLLSSPTNAYSVVFQADRYYPALQAQEFSVITYNSWALLELNLKIYERSLLGYFGQSKNTVIDETTLPFNLVF